MRNIIFARQSDSKPVQTEKLIIPSNKASNIQPLITITITIYLEATQRNKSILEFEPIIPPALDPHRSLVKSQSPRSSSCRSWSKLGWSRDGRCAGSFETTTVLGESAITRANSCRILGAIVKLANTLAKLAFASGEWRPPLREEEQTQRGATR